MKVKQANIEFPQLPRDYCGLCQILAPRPIRDRIDFQNVTEVTDAMAGHKLTADQEDYFDLLCRLIADWESAHLETPKTSSSDALRHLLEAHAMTATDLARVLGVHRTLGAMILRGERKLTLKHVKTLATHFAVSSDIFFDR